MEHDTITISQATAVATPEPTVVMPPAGGAVAIAQETAAERKPPDAVAARPGPAQAPELELLGNQIAELSARIDAATYDLLCHLHEFDRRYGWEGWRSCAHWLNWRTGLDLGAAREKLRVAAALADLNHVSAAMARGQLSYSKVRALTRVASPATEARLLAVALSATAAQVERLVRAWRRVDRDAQPDAEQVLLASRALTMQVDEDGMVVLRGRLPPEVGALLLRAVEAAMEQVPANRGGRRAHDRAAARRRAGAGGRECAGRRARSGQPRRPLPGNGTRASGRSSRPRPGRRSTARFRGNARGQPDAVGAGSSGSAARCRGNARGQPGFVGAGRSGSAARCRRYARGQPGFVGAARSDSAARCRRYARGQPGFVGAARSGSAARCRRYARSQPGFVGAGRSGNAARCRRYARGQPGFVGAGRSGNAARCRRYARGQPGAVGAARSGSAARCRRNARGQPDAVGGGRSGSEPCRGAFGQRASRWWPCGQSCGSRRRR